MNRYSFSEIASKLNEHLLTVVPVGMKPKRKSWSRLPFSVNSALFSAAKIVVRKRDLTHYQRKKKMVKGSEALYASYAIASSSSGQYTRNPLK